MLFYQDYVGLGERPWFQECVQTTWLTLLMLTLIIWQRGYVRFSTMKLLSLTPFPHCALWKAVTAHSPELRREELKPHPWGWGIYIDYLELFCIGHLCLSLPLFIYPTFIYISMDCCILILYFGYNPTLLYFVTQTLSVFVMEALSVGSRLPLTHPQSMWGLVLFGFKHYFPLWHYKKQLVYQITSSADHDLRWPQK